MISLHDNLMALSHDVIIYNVMLHYAIITLLYDALCHNIIK